MRPDLTEAAFDSEGYFHTGDIGVIHENGIISIIDRSKNIFKLYSSEKAGFVYITPERIENIFAQSNFISQVFVYGDMHKSCCVAIVVPEPIAVQRWASKVPGKDASKVVGE